MFSMLDYDGTITKIDVTSGYTDASGDWIAESTVETPISGHVSDLSLEEREFISPGILNTGSRKLATSTHLNAGDRVRIDLTEYTVSTVMYTTHVLGRHTGTERTTYILSKN